MNGIMPERFNSTSAPLGFFPSMSNYLARICQATADAEVVDGQPQATGCTQPVGHTGPHVGTVFWYEQEGSKG